jgi:uncharacterized flavoprotein (TIGR03862 family)
VNQVLVIGGGPAGMRAAEVANERGAQTVLCDGQSSFGRKFLIAGRGGLNLTHSEAVENFLDRYADERARWRDLLNEFGPAQLCEWVHSLGIETYIGSSGRIFPEGQKAAGLLRKWLEKLRRIGVDFRFGALFAGLEPVEKGWRVRFEGGDVEARSVVLALGGASYPETGSDGKWPAILLTLGIEIASWRPANCGWEVDWPKEFLERAEGKPLKNLLVRAGNEEVSGELLVTRYGLEGGAIYRLGRTLHEMDRPELLVDLKPQLSRDLLRERARSFQKPVDWFRSWKLHPAATALLETSGTVRDVEQAIELVKNFRVRLRGPRPIAEAISSAGGIRWSELDESLMLRKAPGIFVAGEMIDWQAPTGGYLLQGCLSTGTRAGRSAAEWNRKLSE